MRRVLGIATIALFTTIAGAADAQQSGRAEDVAAARALAVEGIKLADAGNCAAAVEKLERAEALRHAPTILGRLGECQVQLGKIVLGTENLNRVVREQLAADAPPAFRDAQTRAQKVLDSALPRIAKLKITVEPPGVQAAVKVDGEAVPPAVLGYERPTDPGNHQIEATAPGYLAASSQVRLTDGGSESVTLRLQPDPNAAAAAPPPVAGGQPPATALPPPGAQPGAQPAPEAAVDTGSAGGSKVLPFVVLGVGGAGLIVSAITGVIANSKTKDLEDVCPDKQCGPKAYDDYDSANNMATVSTISFGVGVVGVGVGVVLLLTSGGGSSEQPAAPAAARIHRTPRVTPFIGLNTAGVSGTF